MKEAVEKELYEEATKIRDEIKRLEQGEIGS
jgi:protein-arginine kinase activator protein McsA